jgi:hypothetical protein
MTRPRQIHSCKFGVPTAYNAPVSDPCLVTSEVYAVVAEPIECSEREFVLSLIRSNDLIANNAAPSLTVTRPHFRGEARGQLPRPNFVPGMYQNLRESHRRLPCSLARAFMSGWKN